MGRRAIQKALAEAKPIPEKDLTEGVPMSLSEVTEVTKVTSSESATDSESQELANVTSAKQGEVTEVTPQIFWGEGYFQLQKSGVYYIIPKRDDKPEQKTWICSPLKIRAATRDEDGNNWGNLLVFWDGDNREHQWAMPWELFKGAGDEYRGELFFQGLKIAPGRKARELLTVYIQMSQPTLKAHCVNKTGWYENKFVLPNGTVIGKQSSELLLLQTIKPVQHGVKTKGSLDDWQKTVSRYCRANTRLLFAVALAFAAVLLELLDEESGGFNLRGLSSIGKTTILLILASVLGTKDYVKSCRATINGLEGIAAAYNNLALPLDEIGQLNPHETAELGYLLANEKGKNRANKLGAARAAYTWKILFLLSGEKTLAEHMAKAGHKTTAGVGVRVPDINADTGKYGAFEDLHGFNDGIEFVSELKGAAAANHGTAGIAFIEKLCLESADDLQRQWKEFLADFLSEHVPKDAGEQVKRVAQRFALVAFGGELATHYGITGWDENEALGASVNLFKSWLKERGSAEEYEKTEILEQVRLFFELHGQSRFEDGESTSTEKSRIILRAGRRDISGDKIDYYILPKVFQSEVIKAHNRNYAIDILENNEDMQLIPDAKNPKIKQVTKRIDGMSQKCYHIVVKAATEPSTV